MPKKDRSDANKKTKVISGFPGVGKTALVNALRERGISALDSDSSDFSWIREGERHPEFPKNYINHIRENIGKVEYIFVSSHGVVRDALKEHEIEYMLVYPNIELMEEYTVRYEKRKSADAFVRFIRNNWFDFIKEIKQETFPMLVELGPGEYLAYVYDYEYYRAKNHLEEIE